MSVVWIFVSSWLALAGPEPGRVELAGPRWSQLQPPPVPEPAPTVVDRDVRLTATDGGIEVHGRWRIRLPDGARPAWFANQIADARLHLRELTVDGAPADVWSGPSGATLVHRITGETLVELRGFLPADTSVPVQVSLLGAVRGRLERRGLDGLPRVEDESGRVVVDRGTHLVTGAANFRLVPAPTTSGTERIVVAKVGIGVTAGDGEVTGRARIRWEIRRGSVDRVAVQLEEVGADLRVEGPNVADWVRSGDRIDIELRTPADRDVGVDLSWTRPISSAAESRLPLPRLIPTEAFRVESSLEVALDGELDAVPDASGWTPIASAQLAAWGRGLVDGRSTTAFSHVGEPSTRAMLTLLRYVPLPGPPLVIDVADVVVSSTEEGRFAMRLRYEVLNERAAHLTFTLPEGTTLTGITVAGLPSRASADGKQLRVPLPRSMETLHGPSRVPVVIGVIGSASAWSRRTRGDLPLPTVDAPVSVLRVTHSLPRRYRSRLRPGDRSVVATFSRGNDVAYGLLDDRVVSQVDQMYAAAVEDWNNNEFRNAQVKLAEIDRLGASGKNKDGLVANVDLVLGKSAPEVTSTAPMPQDAPAPVAQSATARRIRAQARARASKKRIEYRDRRRKAKSLQEAGRYDEAKAEYERAIEEANELDSLEDEESRSYAFEADELAGELQTTIEQEANRDLLEASNVEAEQALYEPGEDFGFARPTSPSGVSIPPAVLPIVVPRVGDTVRHQFLLLETGAKRTVPFDVRRTRGTR